MHDSLSLLMFVALFVFLLAGFPVAFTLGGIAIFFGLFTFGLDLFNLLPMRIWGIMNNQVMIAVPLFVFMGVMLEKSGVAEELLETMALLLGRVKGGLALSVIAVGTLLASSTGIVGATVVTMGLLSLPTMLKRGYSTEMACGTIAASGTLGQIIPPSIVLILLASMLNIPVGDIFMGALIPGFMLVGLYLLWAVVFAFIHPQSAPPIPAEELAHFKGLVRLKLVFKAFLPPIFLILAVLGSIFAGIASPTEAAAVGALGATILAVLKRKFNIPNLRAVMHDTITLTSMVFIILVGATAFSLVFRGMGGDRFLSQLILSSDLSPHMFLAMVMIAFFVAGFFLDFIEIIFIFVPVVAPIFVLMDMDLLWIGVLIALNLQTSFLTPPFGFALLFLKGVAPPSVTTEQIYKGIVPYVIIQLIAVAIIIIFPQIATWLPQYLAR